jgi:predicted transcriptional regulator
LPRINKIKELMNETPLISIEKNTTVEEAIKLLKDSGKATIFVKEDPSIKEPQKILTLSDVIGKNKRAKIDSFINSLEGVSSVDEDDDIHPVLNKLASHPITLVKNKKQEPVGVISSTDIERYLDQL